MRTEAEVTALVPLLKMALFEMGYEHADARAICPDGEWFLQISTVVPEAVTWQAFWVVDPDATPCWSCWSGRDGYKGADGFHQEQECVAGRCFSDGPKRPPRELLVPKR